MVQWLRFHASTARDLGSIPYQRTKMLHALQCRKKKKRGGVGGGEGNMIALQAMNFLMVGL